LSAPAVVQANDEDLSYFAKRRCKDEHERALWFHLAEMAPHGAWVAKDVATPIGITIPHAMEDEWFLSELFVEPGFRGQGVARELLSAAAGPPGEATRSGMLDPKETGGLAFFAERGIAIHTPVVSISGEIPRAEALARMASGEHRFRTEKLAMEDHRTALSALDREVRGCARLLDHQYFLENAHGVAFYLRDEFVAYAYVWPSGRIGPIGVLSATYAVQVFAFALAALKRTYEASWCTLLIPGTNVRAMRAAMRANLKIDEIHLFASDGSAGDLSRYIGLSRLLF